MKKLFYFILFTLFFGGILLVLNNSTKIAKADTGGPASISATYNTSTGQLDASGQYSWDKCKTTNREKIVGFALFINGGNPTSNDANALDGSGMHLANSGDPCTTDPGSWSDNSHTLTTKPDSVCVVIYDVKNGETSGKHSQIGAGANRNDDNSYEEGKGDPSYPEGSCVAPTVVSPTATPTPTETPCKGDCEPTVTPTPTNTPSNPGGPGDGKSDGRSDGKSSCPECTQAPSGQVLGTSTGPIKAVLGLSTTSGEGNIYFGLVQLVSALALTATGFKFFKKNA